MALRIAFQSHHAASLPTGTQQFSIKSDNNTRFPSSKLLPTKRIYLIFALSMFMYSAQIKLYSTLSPNVSAEKKKYLTHPSN